MRRLNSQADIWQISIYPEKPQGTNAYVEHTTVSISSSTQQRMPQMGISSTRAHVVLDRDIANHAGFAIADCSMDNEKFVMTQQMN